MNLSRYQRQTLERNIKIVAKLEEGLTPKEAAKAFGVSVATVYRLRKNFKCQKIEGLIPGDKAPKTAKKAHKSATQMILSLRDETNFGAEKIYDSLIARSAEYGLEKEYIPKPRTIHEILRENDRISPRIKWNKGQKPDYYNIRDIENPCRIVEYDLKCDHFVAREPVVVFGIIDISAKVITTRIHHTQESIPVCTTFLYHCYRYGIPEIVKLDNDMAFIGQVWGTGFSLFTRLCLWLGTEQVFIPIHSPRWNPFIESFFRTWDREFFNVNYFSSFEELIELNETFTNRYLCQRSHQGLKRTISNTARIKIPIEFFKEKANPRYPQVPKEELLRMLQSKDISLREGKVSFVRRVPHSGLISFKGQEITIPKSLVGQFIKITVYVEPGKKNYPMRIFFKDMLLRDDTYKLRKYLPRKF